MTNRENASMSTTIKDTTMFWTFEVKLPSAYATYQRSTVIYDNIPDAVEGLRRLSKEMAQNGIFPEFRMCCVEMDNETDRAPLAAVA